MRSEEGERVKAGEEKEEVKAEAGGWMGWGRERDKSWGFHSLERAPTPPPIARSARYCTGHFPPRRGTNLTSV